MTDSILNNLPLWTSAVKNKSAAGRGSRSKLELTGIKKLRELILELAVRGQLVPQDANDEPASELLKRIAAEKAELVKAGKLKKQKPLPEITDDEKPFALPRGWEWVRLGDALEVINGRAYKKTEMLDKGTPILRVGNLFTSNEWYYSDLELEPEKYIDDGDLIYAWSASFGPFIWQGGKVIYHYHIWKLDIFDCSSTSKEFLYLYLKSITEQIKASGNGIAMLHMTKERMEQLLVPVPSFSEQKRIVAKVDKLMALCDQLEQQTENQLSAHQQLVETLLATLTNIESSEELNANWARLAAHFDLLFSGPMGSWAVDRLKDTILQLAFTGKLIEPAKDPSHAENLLKKIKNDQVQRYIRKEIQRPSEISVSWVYPFEYPASWKLVLLNDVAFVTKLAGFEYTKYFDLKDTGEVPVIRAQNVRSFYPDLNNLKYIDSNTSNLLSRSAIDKDCLLVTFIGAGIGDVCVIKPSYRYHLAPNVAKIEPFYETNLDFISYYLNSPAGKLELFKSMKSTAQPSLSMSSIREVWMPLASLEEQTRIVEKVDQLFVLCDQLKAALDSACDTQLQLSHAVAEHALSRQ